MYSYNLRKLYVSAIKIVHVQINFIILNSKKMSTPSLKLESCMDITIPNVLRRDIAVVRIRLSIFKKRCRCFQRI